MQGVSAVPVIPPRPEDITLTVRLQPKELDTVDFILDLLTEEGSAYSRNDLLRAFVTFGAEAHLKERAEHAKAYAKEFEAFHAEREQGRKPKKR